MTNLKKTAEVSIRLPKQASLPKPPELIGMAHEARRARKRIEMPWQPESRPYPVIIAVEFDYKTNQMSWMIYNSHHSEAKLEWSEVDPDPTKVVLALRDWYARARDTEQWFKNTAVPAGMEPASPEPPPAPAAEPLPQPMHSPLPEPAPQHYPPQQYPPQQGAMHAPPAGGPGAYPPQHPYPQTPGGVPTWNGYPQPQSYPYPYPYAVPPAPPHWVQGAPQQQPSPAVSARNDQPQQPLAPELWALHGNSGAPSASGGTSSPKLGDLLVASGVIPTRTLQAALTVQTTTNIEKRKIGEILVDSGALPARVLDAAVRLQEMAREKQITHQRVTDLLRQLHATGATLEELLKGTGRAAVKPRGDMLMEEEERKVTKEERNKVSQVFNVLKEANLEGEAGKTRCHDMLELLQKASIVTPQVIDNELKANKDNVVDAVKALLVKELMDPTTFEAALGCVKLIEMERFKIEQAVIALGYCSRSRVGLKDAISDLNWLIPTDGI